MDVDTIIIMLAMVSMTTGLACVFENSLREIRRHVGDLRDRTARIEGMFRGFADRIV